MLSCNLQHLALCLTEQNAKLLIFEFGIAIADEDVDLVRVELLSKVIVRLVTALHSLPGLPPFPLQKCIVPIVALLKAETKDPKMKVMVIQMMTFILSEQLGDISSLQMTFLNNGVMKNLAECLDEMDSDDIYPETVIRLIHRLCHKNQAAKVLNLKFSILQM